MHVAVTAASNFHRGADHGVDQRHDAIRRRRRGQDRARIDGFDAGHGPDIYNRLGGSGNSPLPTELGGTQVYFNGIRAPVVYVSPENVTAQIPWELADTTSINAFVRSVNSSAAS